MNSAVVYSHLLHSNTLSQISWEVDIQSLGDGKPIGHELERNDIQETLKTIDSLGNFDLFRLTLLELLVIGIADDNRLAGTCDDLLIRIE